MDEYLKPNSSFLRLLNEYSEYGSLIIGVDFDNTLYDYHKKGENYEMVRQLVRDLKEIGCQIIIWTASNDLQFVEQFCRENNIPNDGINIQGIKLGWESRKPFFSALLDDRAGLQQVYQELNLLTKIVREV